MIECRRQDNRSGNFDRPKSKHCMLHYAIIFIVLAIIAAFFGFSGIAGTAAWIAQVLLVVFLVLFIVSFFFRGRGPTV